MNGMQFALHDGTRLLPPGQAAVKKKGIKAIRILLIDDHRLFLAGIRSVIEKEPGLTVIGEALNRTQAIDAICNQPEIILLDLDLGNENSLDFLPELIQASSGARILVVTGFSDPELHLRALRLGAMGVLLKGEPPEILFKAIRKVHAGELWINRSMVATVMTNLLGEAETKKADPEAKKIASLTPRELEVITLIGKGLKNKQIGDRLFISEKTVRHYLTSIFGKLAVKDRLELLIYSYQHGLVGIPSLPFQKKTAI
jgi:DNA-binding NarL/FixJ family response regulator